MDQGDGTFAPIEGALSEVLEKLSTAERNVMSREDIATLWPRLFRVGEEIEIRRSRFRLEYIGTDVLVLKLLPAQE